MDLFSSLLLGYVGTVTMLASAIGPTAEKVFRSVLPG